MQISIIAIQTHVKITEHALMELLLSHATVLMDGLERPAKRVIIIFNSFSLEPMNTRPYVIFVHKNLLRIYFQILTNVNQIHVKMERHALMESIPILANVLRGILDTIVRKVRFDEKSLPVIFYRRGPRFSEIIPIVTVFLR